MFYLISQQTITRFLILTTLLLAMLFVLGCDSSIDTPTLGTTEMESDESFAAAPAVQPANLAQAVVPTIELKKYYNGTITDYLTIAKPIAPLSAVVGAAVVDGYGPPEILGRIYTNKISGTVALNLYWSRIKQDFLTTAGVAPNGYVFVRVEGYIIPIPNTSTPGTVLLRLFWSPNRQDFLTTTGAAPAGYGLVQTEGFIFAP